MTIVDHHMNNNRSKNADANYEAEFDKVSADYVNFSGLLIKNDWKPGDLVFDNASNILRFYDKNGTLIELNGGGSGADGWSKTGNVVGSGTKIGATNDQTFHIIADNQNVLQITKNGIDAGSKYIKTSIVPANDNDMVNKLYADGKFLDKTVGGDVNGTLSLKSDSGRKLALFHGSANHGYISWMDNSEVPVQKAYLGFGTPGTQDFMLANVNDANILVISNGETIMDIDDNSVDINKPMNSQGITYSGALLPHATLGRLKIPIHSAAPASPIQSEMYFDTSFGKLMWYTGAEWKSIPFYTRQMTYYGEFSQLRFTSSAVTTPWGSMHKNNANAENNNATPTIFTANLYANPPEIFVGFPGIYGSGFDRAVLTMTDMHGSDEVVQYQCGKPLVNELSTEPLYFAITPVVNYTIQTVAATYQVMNLNVSFQLLIE